MMGRACIRIQVCYGGFPDRNGGDGLLEGPAAETSYRHMTKRDIPPSRTPSVGAFRNKAQELTTVPISPVRKRARRGEQNQSGGNPPRRQASATEPPMPWRVAMMPDRFSGNDADGRRLRDVCWIGRSSTTEKTLPNALFGPAGRESNNSSVPAPTGHCYSARLMREPRIGARRYSVVTFRIQVASRWGPDTFSYKYSNKR
jgi:hypothetical protein